jgi:predicted dehydrogenase
MKGILDRKEMGSIRSMRAGWLRKNGVPRPGTWITSKSMAGGGVLIDLGSHIIDLCLMFLQQEGAHQQVLTIGRNETGAEDHSAGWFEKNEQGLLEIDVETSVRAKMVFSGDIIVDVELDWMATIENDVTYFEIVCTEGVIELNTLFGFSTNRSSDEDQITIRTKSGKVTNIWLDGKERNAEAAFFQMAKEFFRCIRDDAAPVVTSEDGYNTVHLIDELYQSVQEP